MVRPFRYEQTKEEGGGRDETESGGDEGKGGEGDEEDGG